MAETSEQKQGTNCKFSLRKNILGILYAMSSCVFFAFSSLFVKLLREIPPQEVVLFRSFIQIIFILPPMVFNQVPLLGEVRYLPYLCVRGLAGTLALCCQFYAFQHLPLADATVIIFSSPIFTGILAFLLLGEAWDGFDAMSTILCFIGVVLIARPTFIFPRPTSHRPSVAVNDWEQVTASLVALCGAVLTSIALIAIRKMKGVHFLVPVFYVALSGVAITAGAILASGTLSSVVCGSHHELLILGVGWCGVGTYFLFLVMLFLCLSLCLSLCPCLCLFSCPSLISLPLSICLSVSVSRFL